MDQYRQSKSEEVEYAFREVSTEDEMREVLTLRKVVYEQRFGAQEFNSVARVAAMDLDTFDLTSHHFALLARIGATDQVVGSLRITTDVPGPMESMLRRIASQHHALSAQLEKGRSTPLPMLAHLPLQSGAREAIAGLGARPGRLAEAGRLAVAPSHRTFAARQGLRLGQFMVECASAVGWHILGLSDVVLACDPTLRRLYGAFGFAQLRGTQCTLDAVFGVHFLVLHATPQSLPASLRAPVLARAAEMSASGEMLLRPSACAPIVPAKDGYAHPIAAVA